MNALDAPLSLRLPARQARLLAKVGIETVGDLLMRAPRRYYHWGRLTPLHSLHEGEDVTILAEVASTRVVANRSGSGVRLEATLTDGVAYISATFFAKNQYKLAPIERILTPGHSFLFAGKIGSYRGHLQLTHPSFEGVDGEDIDRLATRPIPVYPATASLTSWALSRAITMVLDATDDADIPDLVPEKVREKMRIPTYARSLRQLHAPHDDADYGEAKRALAFTEAFIIQSGLALRAAAERATTVPASPATSPTLTRFRSCLPFTLTPSQEKALETVSADIAGSHPMRRLLQGDVGSGKTVVALGALLQVVTAGHQGVFVAPTTILAEQHLSSMRALLAPLGAEAPQLRLLIGSTAPAQRREITELLEAGTPMIVVGTHTLLGEGISFPNLALAVIDEQHRFGVEQRSRLRNGRSDGAGIHELVMTATPIPRTIAMTVFGDLDETRMEGLPEGRTPVSTYLADALNAPWMERLWVRCREEIDAGHRVYVVCPRIDANDPLTDTSGEDDSTTRPLASVAEVAATLRAHPALAGVPIRELTGPMPPALKAEVMAEFASGAAPLMVATNLIDVGVDVKEATLMIIVDAQQFGLAQLHQLRGRVGRSHLPSLCVAVHRHDLSEGSLQRLEAFASTTDGFALAEADLRLRREGDVVGSEQSGTSRHLRFLSVARDAALISAAKDEASALIAADPALASHPHLEREVRITFGEAITWAARS